MAECFHCTRSPLVVFTREESVCTNIVRLKRVADASQMSEQCAFHRSDFASSVFKGRRVIARRFG